MNEHKHCEVPSKQKGKAGYVSSDGFRLAGWVLRQKNNRSNLSHERVKKLECLTGWSWNLRTDKWGQKFELLKLYVNEHGDCDVPRSFVSLDGVKLGIWVRQQVLQWNTRLSDESKTKLLSLNGWKALLG